MFASVATFFFNSAMYGLLFLLPQFFQVAQGHGFLDAGLRLLPWTATLFLVAPLSGALINRLGERTLIGVGLALQAASLAWISNRHTGCRLFQAHSAVDPHRFGGFVGDACGAECDPQLGRQARYRQSAGIYNMIRFLGGVCIAVAGAVFVGHEVWLRRKHSRPDLSLRCRLQRHCLRCACRRLCEPDRAQCTGTSSNRISWGSA